MPNQQLPERASLEFLKKTAKDRLMELRRGDPRAKLADALLAVARDYGFSSWRALKAELDRRREAHAALFFAACEKGDVETARRLIAKEPSLVRAADPSRDHGRWTGLHTAAQRDRVELLRALLELGADPNAREEGDNTPPLHWAAAGGNTECVRALLDAGVDAQGVGDDHQLDAIGWATVWRPENDIPQDTIALLLERGARHHVISAIAAGDTAAIQRLVEENPEALDRRLSRFEGGQTALHFAIRRKRPDLLQLLIELGADVEARDGSGRTPLEVAIMSGGRESIERLRAAGAVEPAPLPLADFRAGAAQAGEKVRKCVASMNVPDIPRTLDWYTSIGFKEVGRYSDGGVVNWGMLEYGNAQVMLGMRGKPGPQNVSLWFYTDDAEELYRLFKARQLEAAKGRPEEMIEFLEDLYEPFYGGKQFSIRDLNGYGLVFYEEGN
jgi:ankyrin repeat protein/catechol 2,3-dioxygenase-like lactoylglutathione lyase family enzyme